MKKFKELLSGFIALAIMVLAVIGILNLLGKGLAAIWAGFLNLISTISTLDTVLIIALISGTITILGLIVNSIISILIKSLEHKNKLREEIRAKMEKPYEKFINMIYDMLMDSKSNKKFNEAEVIKKMYEFSKEVTLHGSNKVVKKWVKYRTSAGKLTPVENMKLLEEILFAIRDDLGIKKRKMKTGDLLSLIVNDIDEVLKKK